MWNRLVVKLLAFPMVGSTHHHFLVHINWINRWQHASVAWSEFLLKMKNWRSNDCELVHTKHFNALNVKKGVVLFYAPFSLSLFHMGTRTLLMFMCLLVFIELLLTWVSFFLAHLLRGRKYLYGDAWSNMNTIQRNGFHSRWCINQIPTLFLFYSILFHSIFFLHEIALALKVYLLVILSSNVFHMQVSYSNEVKYDVHSCL